MGEAARAAAGGGRIRPLLARSGPCSSRRPAPPPPTAVRSPSAAPGRHGTRARRGRHARALPRRARACAVGEKGEAEPLRRQGRRATSAAAAPPGEEGAAAGEGRGRAPSTTRAKAGGGGSGPTSPCSLHAKARGNAEKAANGRSGPAPAPLLHAEAHGRAGGARRRRIRPPSPRRPRKGAAPAAPGHAAGGRGRERGSGGGE
ncbi:translation initiation factor IF-2-like [Panicum virgatum]|uniref:translation initiation factor IF-2-like n=1 Tax=Panicum virgatum TaxID=38727 RepID=UPI0019D5F18F|nr:translation initiation factor IF-2-like [Panicum virgatum]